MIRISEHNFVQAVVRSCQHMVTSGIGNMAYVVNWIEECSNMIISHVGVYWLMKWCH